MRVDVSRDISKATLDIIGMAGTSRAVFPASKEGFPDAFLRLGFNYDFQALDAGDTPNELSAAFQQLFTNLRSFSLFGYLMAFIPVFRLIVSSIRGSLLLS